MPKALFRAARLAPLFFALSCFRPPAAGPGSQGAAPGDSGGKKKKELLINGGGASLPYILYSNWLLEYKKIKPAVSINYQSIGSAGGVRQLFKGTLDFGATDIPVSREEARKASMPVEHIPAAVEAVAIAYNLKLPEGQALHLDGKALAGIFMGTIKKWNDPALQAINKAAALPPEPIIPVYRADGSGGTAFFTEYLSASSKEFLERVGKGKSVSWPAGVGAKGNEGALGLVSKMGGSVAYIARSYALSRKMPMAKIKNPAGRFVSPSDEAIRLAAAGGGWMRSLVNAKGRGAYPISGFTYIVLSPKMPEEKKQALAGFLIWALGPGQKFSKSLRFVSLPAGIQKAAIGRLSRMSAE